MGARPNGISIARAKTQSRSGRAEKGQPMALAPPVLCHTVPMAPEHRHVAATVRDGAGQCPLCARSNGLSANASPLLSLTRRRHQLSPAQRQLNPLAHVALLLDIRWRVELRRRLHTCRRHYPGVGSERILRSFHPDVRISLPRKGCRVDLRIVLFEACSAFTRGCGLHTRAVTNS
jgi:hypothetical protein